VKYKTLKGAALVVATSMLPLSQVAMADVTISGWINEGVTWYDDGVFSDGVQVTDNGTTLGSRITFAASSEVATGITAGFETILEPRSQDAAVTSNLLGLGSSGQFNDNSNGQSINVLGSSVHVGGGWGKLTVGLQTMPTDNIAVLEDPSLTLWSSISPIFKGNGSTIRGLVGATKTTWGAFLQCYAVPGLGIGIDCNGIYRNGVRYDLPAFGPVSIAVGWANDDVYDISAKWKGDMGSVKAQIALGYALNQGGGGSNVRAAGSTSGSESETFQLQAGLMHPSSGLFGSIAYQREEVDVTTAADVVAAADDTDAWWLKVGVKKAWFDAGDTSLSFQYGQYSDQFAAAADGITGSEVERIGISVDQYFGSSLIIYGVWEQLDLDVSGTAATAVAYGGAQDLDTFTLAAIYFF
jgi:hypothetical protein